MERIDEKETKRIQTDRQMYIFKKTQIKGSSMSLIQTGSRKLELPKILLSSFDFQLNSN